LDTKFRGVVASGGRSLRIAFFINTPAHVHLYKNVVKTLEHSGHQAIILARNYGDTVSLLDEMGFEYFVYANVPDSKYGKILALPFNVLTAYNFLRKKNPDLLVGMGVYSAYTSQLLQKKCIIFNDSEPTPFQFMLFKPFVDVVLTPSSFTKDLGPKHIKFNSFKEIAYLHTNYFVPDVNIHDFLGISQNEDYVLLRFNAFDAVHDFGINGFSIDQKRLLVNELSKHARVFISSELELPEDFNKHLLKIPKSRIHDILYYAKLVVADTQTITTESAVLGTPVVRFNSFVGKKDMGNFIELENKYHLIFSFNDPKKAIDKAAELIQEPDLKKKWKEKRDKFLVDKIDTTQFLASFIGDYPESLNKIRAAQKYSKRDGSPITLQGELL
jgi:predicted glycosyltransferase